MVFATWNIRVLQTSPRYDTKIILGDLNAQIGRESFTKNVAGAYSLHEDTNDNGKHLCQFAEGNNMIIKSTCFPHKNIHVGTWKAPNGSLAQIDHVLINKRNSSSIIDVKAARGPNCESDHYLVKVKFRERLACVELGKMYKRKAWDLEKFKDPNNIIQYKSVSDKEMNEELELNENEDEEKKVEKSWNRIRKVIEKAADEVIGESVRVRNEGWFDEECREALMLRNEHRLIMMQRSTRQNTTNYMVSRRRAKKVLRRKKKEFLKKQIEQIEELKTNNETRKFYGAVRQINRGFQPKTDACKDRNGNIIEGKAKAIDRWVEYFGELVGSNSDQRTDSSPALDLDLNLNLSTLAMDDEKDLEPPDMEDLLQSIEKLKNRKAPGEDALVAEFFKNAGEIVISQLYSLIFDVWEREKMPDDWNNSLICPKNKKGDRMQCENYRGISLLGVGYKIFSNILLDKLSVYAESILCDYQCGFRRGRSTTDQIYVMRQLIEKCWEYKIDLHILFIDYRQAFDSVNRVSMIKALQEFQVPNKLIRLIVMSLKNSEGKVLVGGNLSKEFPIMTGVRQGDALSATLFNLALQKIVSNINMNINGNILYSCSQVCAYADDICLVARSAQYLKELFTTLNNEGKSMGLRINEKKTKYMKVGGAGQTTNALAIDGFTFENVGSFIYLGAELNQENKMINEVNRRIMSANRAYFANLKFFRSSLLSRHTKMCLYKTLVRPVLTYGAETWTLTASMCTSLKIFERKILRKIYGPVFDSESNAWRIRSNEELYSLFQDTNVVQFIKARRIEWLGHVTRMPNTRMPSRLLHGIIIGKRRVGRPRRRWVQDVEEDLRILGVRNWKDKARDRGAWNAIVREAKAHPGL